MNPIKVVSKTPSKTKIYLISQDEFVPIEDGAIDNLNTSIVEKTELLDQKRAQFDNIKEKTKSVGKEFSIFIIYSIIILDILIVFIVLRHLKDSIISYKSQMFLCR